MHGLSCVSSTLYVLPSGTLSGAKKDGTAAGLSHTISGGTLWANLHLLFWLSLIPFVSAWMGEHQFAAAPVAADGAVLLMCAVA